MSIILGLDTGGTYTDGVLVDKETRIVLSKAKALTTKEKLSIGIEECIENLSISCIEEISLVCFSTTLATNAIVEDKGCDSGLVIIGKHPEGPVPTPNVHTVRGVMDIYGNPIVSIDKDEIREVASRLKKSVDAVAVSGYASVRNPCLEKEVKEILSEEFGIPVVCAHELTSMLGYYERTVTAVLNARLIPIINELICECRLILDRIGVSAPLMIVKSDASLMLDETAVKKPVETILSGPAASIHGGLFLSGMRDALIIDIGGTTTDVADIEEQTIRLNENGSDIGGWRTRVKAVDITTRGLGGDSRLVIDDNMKYGISFGPERVTPLCRACFFDRSLVEKLERCGETTGKDRGLRGFLKALYDLNPTRPTSFTPTDVLHAKGLYTKWLSSASGIAAGMIARELSMPTEDFLDICIEQVSDQLADASLAGTRKSLCDNKRHKGKTIVAIGAPALSWSGSLSRKLAREVIVPSNAEVANAIGAAIGKVVHRTEALIRPEPYTDDFVTYTKAGRETFKDYDDAVTYCMTSLKEYLAALCEADGASLQEFIEETDPVYTTDPYTYVETRITISAIANPNTV